MESCYDVTFAKAGLGNESESSATHRMKPSMKRAQGSLTSETISTYIAVQESLWENFHNVTFAKAGMGNESESSATQRVKSSIKNAQGSLSPKHFNLCFSAVEEKLS